MIPGASGPISRVAISLLAFAMAGCTGSGAFVEDDDDTNTGDDDTTTTDDDDDDTTTDDDDTTTTDDDDTTATDDDDTTPADDDDDVEPSVCGFETGYLAGFGHPGMDWWASPEGGMVVIVEEGDDFSGLVGEEALIFEGDHAALLRSSEDADPDTWGHLVTDPFVPVVPTLVFDQLSEVDDRGVELDLAILDEYGVVLQQQTVPVETGGFVPGLPPGGQPLPDFPEIVQGGGTPGAFVQHVIDLTPYWQSGETIQVRIRQHTRIEGAGFFTLLDDVCNADP
jgi:hypothetical protein